METNTTHVVLPRDPQAGVRPVPIPGQVISVILSFAAITVLTMFMSTSRPAAVLVDQCRLTFIFLSFSAQRFLVIRSWTRLPFVVWRKLFRSLIKHWTLSRVEADQNVAVVFAIYLDSYLFVVTTALLQHSFGVNSSSEICEGAILLCLVCYVTSKVSFVAFCVAREVLLTSNDRS